MEIKTNCGFSLTDRERPINYRISSSALAVAKDKKSSGSSPVNDGNSVGLPGETPVGLEFDKLRYQDSEWRKRLEEEQAAKQAAWEAAGAVVHNAAYRIIPNIQTNDQLVKSFDGLDKKVVDTAYDIINDHFLRQDAGSLTAEQRRGLISLGMEKARYLAANYMDDDTANRFLGAMEKIAQYSMNGTIDENGRVTFDIRKGPLVGAPDDNAVDYEDLMKSLAPDKYNEYSALIQEGISGGDNAKIGRAMELFMNWSMDLSRNKQTIGEAVTDYTDWKKTNAETKVSDAYRSSDYSGIDVFLDSIRSQNASNLLFSVDYLENSLQSFLKRLGIA